MRLSLSRLTAVLVIGVALATVPGVAVSRTAGREGTLRMTSRGGLHRFSASEAVALGSDDTAPDVTTASELVSDSTAPRDAGSPAGLPPAATAVVAPSAGSVLLDTPPPATLHPADAFLRPPGRAPPAR
ncbi:MAG TPA: hypothetical protein VIY56_01230 [Vicinamibacterales bacterium]